MVRPINPHQRAHDLAAEVRSLAPDGRTARRQHRTTAGRRRARPAGTRNRPIWRAPRSEAGLPAGQAGLYLVSDPRQPGHGGIDRRTDRAGDERTHAAAERERERHEPAGLSNETPHEDPGHGPGHRCDHYETDVGPHLCSEGCVRAGEHRGGVGSWSDTGPQGPQRHADDNERRRRDPRTTQVAAGAVLIEVAMTEVAFRRRWIRLPRRDSRVARHPGWRPLFRHAAAGWCARLTALATARREAVTMLPSMPTPHRTRPPTATSRNATACASAPAPIACSL